MHTDIDMLVIKVLSHCKRISLSAEGNSRTDLYQPTNRKLKETVKDISSSRINIETCQIVNFTFHWTPNRLYFYAKPAEMQFFYLLQQFL